MLDSRDRKVKPIVVSTFLTAIEIAAPEVILLKTFIVKDLGG
jgi:hypothetical protein